MAIAPPAVSVEQLEQHRKELTGYCYRMLGSAPDADDAVQEALVRAWNRAGTFEGRSSVRSWLYRIATNVCLDMVRGRERRARPMELRPSSPPDERHLGDFLPESRWVTPIADDRVLRDEADPAEIAAHRESIRLAFVTALQHLPPRQRAVLIFCEVLRWRAAEVAELLETTVASVNSALQRARATLAAVQSGAGPVGLGAAAPAPPTDPSTEQLVSRYVSAFERYDVESLVQLLHQDAIQSMPPYAMWIRGAANIGAWLLGPGFGCKGSRLLPTTANGCPAFGQYRVDPNGGHAPWALQVLEITGDRITGFHAFLDVERLFPAFGLPSHLPE